MDHHLFHSGYSLSFRGARPLLLGPSEKRFLIHRLNMLHCSKKFKPELCAFLTVDSFGFLSESRLDRIRAATIKEALAPIQCCIAEKHLCANA
ncbi:hypothetical protein [Rhodoblastus sp.]|uniref:hypothetical protein n=1 Tax=Rhodoblastus sp. TaxID=1962975 RepID=UPI0035B036C0